MKTTVTSGVGQKPAASAALCDFFFLTSFIFQCFFFPEKSFFLLYFFSFLCVTSFSYEAISAAVSARSLE